MKTLIDFMNLPAHIAIIPDGNRRWATQKGLPSFFGHREGAKTTEKVLTHAVEKGIPYMTFWGASVGNVTKREHKEVQFLFNLFTSYFKKIAKAKIIHKNKVNIRVLGEWEKYFPEETKTAIKSAVAATKDYDAFHLTILLAYSGTMEMLTAINSLLLQASVERSHVSSSGRVLSRESSPFFVTEEELKKRLYTAHLPPVDLVIRTGGEPHLSAGFMMWDIAEAQLFFSKRLWPDFSTDEFEKALSVYATTERRLGK